MGLNLVARIADKSKLLFANKVTVQSVEEINFQSRRLARDFVEQITVYPPEGSGNRPPPPYWERGTGRILAGGGVNPPSQNYKDSWSIEGISTPFGGKVTASTPVTYAPYLMDPNKQAAWHKANGWKTITMVANELGIKIDSTGPATYTVSEGGGYIQMARNKIENFMRSIIS